MRRLAPLLAIVAGLLLLSPGFAMAPPAPLPGWSPGKVVVGFEAAGMTLPEAMLVEHNAREVDRNAVLGFVVYQTDRPEEFAAQAAGVAGVTYAEADGRVSTLEIRTSPSDSLFLQQWALAVIHAEHAWEVESGRTSILVAVVDSGIDYRHADITNYISGGYDWVNDDADPWDDRGHGTHVAGIAAATANNGIGIAGVAQVKVMAEKVLGSDGSGTNSMVASGIQHAADAGARVIVLSLGSSEYSRVLDNAARYAWDKGAVLVAAAGNEDVAGIIYPAALSTVIAVGATDRQDRRADFTSWGSNWGPQLELAAPGHEILSTVPGGRYEAWSGTSMATPHAGGVAALILSRNPALTNQQVRDFLAASADDLGAAGRDEYYGFGRVNAQAAVVQAYIDTVVPVLLLPDIPDFITELPAVSGSAADESPGEVLRVEVGLQEMAQGGYWDGQAWVVDQTWLAASGAAGWSLPLPGLDDGLTYRVLARAVDSAGNVSAVASDVFTVDRTAPEATMLDVDDFENGSIALSGEASDVAPGELDKIQVALASDGRYWNGAGWVAAVTWLDAASFEGSWSFDLPELVDGETYEVRARALDRAGNASPQALDSFIFDSTSPGLALTGASRYLTDLSAISGAAADAAPGQLAGVHVSFRNIDQELYWDGQAWAAPEVWLDAGLPPAWSLALPELADGVSYEAKAQAVDRAGNQSPVASVAFTVDRTAPAVAVDEAPAYRRDVPTLGGLAVDQAPGSLQEVRISFMDVAAARYWDGASWLSQESWLEAEGTARWSFDVPPLQDGRSYRLGARALDMAGNVSDDSGDEFIFDRTIPLIAPEVVPAFVYGLDELSGTASDRAPGQLDAVQVSIRDTGLDRYWNGISWQPAERFLDAGGTAIWSLHLPELAGSHSYELEMKAVDKAGNISTPVSVSFVVDRTSPLVSIADVDDHVAGPSLQGTASDETPGRLQAVQVRLQDAGSGRYWSGGEWTPAQVWLAADGTGQWAVALPALDEGALYEVAVRAVDAAGNLSAPAIESFIVDLTAPDASLAPLSGHVVSLSQLSGAASDAAPGRVSTVRVVLLNMTLGRYWAGDGWVAEETWLPVSGAGSWEMAFPALADGAYSAGVRSWDLAGNGSIPEWQQFVVDGSAPSIAIVALPGHPGDDNILAGTAEDGPLGGLPLVEVAVHDVVRNAYWDGESWVERRTWISAAASAASSWSLALPELAAGGTYQVLARALDVAGNVSATATETFSIRSSGVTPLGWAVIAATLLLTAVALRPRRLAGRSNHGSAARGPRYRPL